MDLSTFLVALSGKNKIIGFYFSDKRSIKKKSVFEVIADVESILNGLKLGGDNKDIVRNRIANVIHRLVAPKTSQYILMAICKKGSKFVTLGSKVIWAATFLFF